MDTDRLEFFTVAQRSMARPVVLDAVSTVQPWLEIKRIKRDAWRS